MNKSILIIAFVFLYVTTVATGQNKVGSDSSISLLKFDGFYSFYDTTKDNDGIQYFNRYKYITPFVFFKNGTVHQFAFSTNDANYLQKALKNKSIVDSGKYVIKGCKIIIEGYFTFYSWGMRLRKYKATYHATIIDGGQAIIIKIAPPYPKINMRLNDQLKSDIEGKTYLFKQ